MKIFQILAILVLCLAVFTSCKEEEKKETPVSTAQQPATNTAETSTEKIELKYNPEHGKEGHRCDLPVGAPLANTDAMQQQQLQSPVRIQPNTPAINPPHGQPGHDCSIPVGAALN
ncbi:MAG: hypothetical protein ABGW91_07495 [Christiangramia sp.]|nr:hypothetical protein [Christiangramia sp.]|tara:strand:+ start:144 stop:491 length:348 start_codon:yes stop_codon:yes gene_type:complete